MSPIISRPDNCSKCHARINQKESLAFIGDTHYCFTCKTKFTGFLQPIKISNDFILFLRSRGNSDLAPGDELSQNNIMKRINDYIKTQNLQNSDNPRVIHYEKDLMFKQLINIKALDEKGELTYFRLVPAIRHHFQ